MTSSRADWLLIGIAVAALVMTVLMVLGPPRYGVADMLPGDTQASHESDGREDR